MFEHRSSPLLSKRAFLKRVIIFFSFSFGIIVFSLALGCTGYHYLGSLSWIDSLLNASMILTGMGPVNYMATNPAKLFASFYALYSGIVFLSTVAIFFAPIVHRFLHIIHVDNEKTNE
jgi:hypothetical protein